MIDQEQATKDLIAVLAQHMTPEGVKDYLRNLRDIEALIQTADDRDGEDRCVAAVRRIRRERIIEPFVRELIRELCHYPPEDRAPVIEAALHQARVTAKQSTRLGQMESRYRAALAALDPRSKALLRIVRELNEVSGNTTDADFLNVWYCEARDWPVDVLRDDPAFAELLGLFDLAELLNEANG
jgi:hypothetical protein